MFSNNLFTTVWKVSFVLFFQTELYSRHLAFYQRFTLFILSHANNCELLNEEGVQKIWHVVCGMFWDADYSVSRILLQSLGNDQWTNCSSYVVYCCLSPCLVRTQLLFLYGHYKVNGVTFIDSLIFSYNLFIWNLITCASILNYLINFSGLWRWKNIFIKFLKPENHLYNILKFQFTSQNKHWFSITQTNRWMLFKSFKIKIHVNFI